MFNNSSNLYNREWLALVFANRNKSYGAYTLRKHSSDNMLRAFLFAAPLFVGLFAGPKLYKALMGEKQTLVYQDPIHRDVVFAMPTEVKPSKEELPAAEAKTEAKKIKSVGFTNNIKVVKDEHADYNPSKLNELKKSIIASTTQEGEAVSGNIRVDVGTGDGAVGLGNGIGVGGNGTGSEIMDVTGVDVYPEFPGGMDAWTKYIQKNLRYPPMAQEGGVQGKVYLSFVVEKDGMITDVKVLKGIGSGCDEEAMRVIKKSPRWKAGMQSNLPVRVRYQMPIAYTINN